MIYRRTFDDRRTSVTDARHFAAAVLDGLSDEFVDAVVLMVSELATNAVEHANSRFEVVIDRHDEGVVVHVSDQGPGEAVPRSPRITDVSGRGLQIVCALADTWGVRAPTADWHKSVWFSLQLRREATDPALE